jgi:hypothetical protein
LSGRDELFRLPGGAKVDTNVERWFDEEPTVLRSLAKQWFERMRACGEDVRELMHDGCPVACVEDAAFGYVNAFRHHVNVGFFHGAALEDPARLLQGTGKRMRHVKILPGREPDPEALGALIARAYSHVRVRLQAHLP